MLPYRICFNLPEDKPTKVIDTIIDITFLIDLVLTFFAETFDDKEFRAVDSHREIAIRYLRSWFVPDLLSVLPFDLLLKLSQGGGDPDGSLASANKSVRIVRIAKIYRLVRLLRIARIAKSYNQLRLNNVRNQEKHSNALLRTISFAVGTVILIHMFACVWASFRFFDKHNWLTLKIESLREGGETIDINDHHKQYFICMYYVIQSVTTVGYGDVNPQNTKERAFVISMMFFGVVCFSFLTGSLSSLLQSADELGLEEQSLMG